MTEEMARSAVIAAAKRVCDPDRPDFAFELEGLERAVSVLLEIEREGEVGQVVE